MSSFFDLERGNAQGDTISPYLFNLGYQILIFKIAYDLQITALGGAIVIPPTHLPLPDGVSTYPRKIFAFADDGNIITKMEIESLSRIKKILEEFGVMSGLECNVEKTAIMQIGSDDPINQDIIITF